MDDSKRLLVVSGTDREPLVGHVSHPGWSVTFAKGLDEGLKKLEDLEPHMVLVDMPVSTLSDTLIALPPKKPEVAFVPILSKLDAQLILRCFRSGCYDVLVKPVLPASLGSLFQRYERFSSLLRENRVYRIKLEKANRELHESLRILELDQLAGRQVQQSMLPETPIRVGEYEIAYKIIPSLYLSGDFVGYNIVFDRFLLFYVADVSGHGASSAFITILMRFFLNRIIRRHVQNKDIKTLTRAPEGFLEHINRQLLDLNLDKHLTIFAGAIDMNRNILRYSMGAHIPGPIFLADGDARFMQGKGKPIGLFPDAVWQIEEIALPEKFLLTVTSDGVLEFIEGDTLQGKLNKILQAISSSQGNLDSICTNLSIQDIENAPDDVTVLTVTRGY